MAEPVAYRITELSAAAAEELGRILADDTVLQHTGIALPELSADELLERERQHQQENE